MGCQSQRILFARRLKDLALQRRSVGGACQQSRGFLLGFLESFAMPLCDWLTSCMQGRSVK